MLPPSAQTQTSCGAPSERGRRWGLCCEDPATRNRSERGPVTFPVPPMQLWGAPPGTVGTGVGSLSYIYLGTRIDSEPENGLFYAICKYKLMPLLKPGTAARRRDRVTVLTLPPPGTCLILSFEPHLDWTLLRSSFLLIICTFDSQKKG